MRNVLIVGSGAREHAFAWKLRQSAEVDRLFIAPGNAGTAAEGENVPIAATDIPAIVRFVEECDIGLTVIGPEAPLALGLADALRAHGRPVVGPGAAAARIESSKSFAKDLMRRIGVPTAAYRIFDDAESARTYLRAAAYPLVIKADGLAAGKGVVICGCPAETEQTVEAFMVRSIHGRAGARIVVEEALAGPEVSLLALVDGERVIPLPLAQDHKRLGDGDTGPNTGGMGAYAPAPLLTDSERDRLCTQLMLPVVEELAARGTPYRGILFAGLMLTPDGPRVLEFNCRGGDPETQVILPLIAGDLLPSLQAVAAGHLDTPLSSTGDCAVGVVLAAPGYPDAPIAGTPIEGLDTVSPDTLIFHAGTARAPDGRIITAGGRVLTIVGIAPTIDQAAHQAYSSPIRFDGMQRRADIAHQARALDSLAPHGCAAEPRLRGAPAPSRRPRIAILAASEGSNLQALIDRRAAGHLDADIALVISHNPHAHALDRAHAAGIPTVTLTLENRRSPLARWHLEDALLRALAPHDPDLIVLAGWMLVLSPEFLASAPCPIINVHPALLEPISGGSFQRELSLGGLRGFPSPPGPLSRCGGRGGASMSDEDCRRAGSIQTEAPPRPPQRERGLGGEGKPCTPHTPEADQSPPFPILRGAHAVRDALQLGLPYTGVSIHHVTPEVDAGPVILAEAVDILPGDTEVSLHARLKAVEHRLLPLAVQILLAATPSGGAHARDHR